MTQQQNHHAQRQLHPACLAIEETQDAQVAAVAELVPTQDVCWQADFVQIPVIDCAHYQPIQSDVHVCERVRYHCCMLVHAQGEKVFVVSDVVTYKRLQAKYYEHDMVQPQIVMASAEQVMMLALKQEKRVWEDLITQQAITTSQISRFAAFLIEYGIGLSASDIHLSPGMQYTQVIYRIDGIRYPLLEMPTTLAQRVSHSWILQSHCDYTQQQIAQDGQLMVYFMKQQHHIRISACPSTLGWSIVMRCQDSVRDIASLAALGMQAGCEKKLYQLMHKTQGLILLTGPTGCGKTQTLYCLLQILLIKNRHIVTFEDPIEKDIAGITQMAISDSSAMDIETALRNVLRQDPDVIVIGEIRDRATAKIALSAAYTGHLVLASCHASSYLSALQRLESLSSLQRPWQKTEMMLVMQRLCRRLCGVCHGQSAECYACQDGFRGRVGLFDALLLDDEVVAGLSDSKNQQDSAAGDSAYQLKSLERSARVLIEAGVTTVEEVRRAIGILYS